MALTATGKECSHTAQVAFSSAVSLLGVPMYLGCRAYQGFCQHALHIAKHASTRQYDTLTVGLSACLQLMFVLQVLQGHTVQ